MDSIEKQLIGRSAAMSLIIAEHFGQRPERVVVDFESEGNTYGLQRRRLDAWGSPRMERCYLVGFEIIPLLAEAAESYSISAEEAVEDSWNDLRQAGLVQGELDDELEGEEFAETVSLAEEVVELLDNNCEAIEEVADILVAKQELQYTEIDEVLDRFNLVFAG